MLLRSLLSVAVATAGVVVYGSGFDFPVAEFSRTPRTWEVADPAISNDYARVEGVNPIWVEGVDYLGRPTRVFAWWGVPAGASAAKKVPAMVLVHGGGGTAFAKWVRTWMDRGYAAIAMDTCGSAPLGEADGRKHPRHAWAGPYGWDNRLGYEDADPRNQWPYHAVAAVMRCHTFIRNRPEVDQSRTGLTGISWGGYLTTIIAGVDHRFGFAAPVYGCAWYDMNPRWDKVAGGGAKYREWLERWDARHYVGGTRCPVLRCNGDSDYYYTVEMTRRTMAALPRDVPAAMSLKHRMSHGHAPSGDPREITVFADYYLKGGCRPLEIVSARADGGRLEVRYRVNDETVASAELLYLVDTVPASDRREWTIVKLDTPPAGKDAVIASVPDAAKIFFVNLRTAKDNVISSPVLFSGKFRPY